MGRQRAGKNLGKWHVLNVWFDSHKYWSKLYSQFRIQLVFGRLESKFFSVVYLLLITSIPLLISNLTSSLELTRLRGHLYAYEKGVHNTKNASRIPGRIPTEDG